MNQAASVHEQAGGQLGSFVGVGGLKIFTRSWQPAEDPPRGVVVHRRMASTRTAATTCGRPSNSPATAWPCTPWTCAGAASPTASASMSTRSPITSTTCIPWSRRPKPHHPGLPVFLLGHSAGGVISCIYTLEHQDELAGLICESFALEVPAPDFALAALKGLSHIAPHAHVFKLNNADFSRDPARRRRHERRPADRARGAAHADGRGDAAPPTTG